MSAATVAHTPGPWTLDDRTIYGGPDEQSIAELCNRGHSSAPRNGRLIAAAPELLSELRRAALLLEDADREWFSHNGSANSASFQKMMAPIHAAIAKAEGREP